jgi:hypothetical protein
MYLGQKIKTAAAKSLPSKNPPPVKQLAVWAEKGELPANPNRSSFVTYFTLPFGP